MKLVIDITKSTELGYKWLLMSTLLKGSETSVHLELTAAFKFPLQDFSETFFSILFAYL